MKNFVLSMLFVVCLVYPSAAMCSTRYQDLCIADMAWMETRGASTTDKWLSIRTVLNRQNYPDDFGYSPCDIIRHRVNHRYEFTWVPSKPNIPRNHPVYKELYDMVHVVRQTPPVGCEKDILFFRTKRTRTGVKGATLCRTGDMKYFAKRLNRQEPHAHTRKTGTRSVSHRRATSVSRKIRR